MAIPNHVFDQLNSQADLVNIIGKHTVLKKSGNEFKGCCPFHGEKTPSFYVNPNKGMYHCFGCGVGGNALTFLQEYENLTFMESVKELSQQTGIEIPEDDDYKVKYQRTPQQPLTKQNTSLYSDNNNAHANNITSINSNPNNTNNKMGSNNIAERVDNNLAANNLVDNNGIINDNITSFTDTQFDTDFFDTVFTDAHYDSNPSYESAYEEVHQEANYDVNYNNYHHNESLPSSNTVRPNLSSNNIVSELTVSNSNVTNSNVPNSNQEGNLYDLLMQVHEFYQNCLKNSKLAYEYFKSRGLTDETIKTFGLGFAPQGWQHLEKQFPNDIEGLKLLGLVRRSEKGRDYDLLRDRVIFVIRDSRGRVIGFAGRALNNDVKPKYINSSDSPVFHKQHVLYGYYESRQHRANDWLVVEGYMDVIALYQAGIYGAIASMGTAINEQQISRLLTLNPVLTLSFDGDLAGQKAAWRTLEISLPVLSDDKELRFLTLPNNHDPDTFITEHGKQAMQEKISHATPFSEYVFQYLSSQHDLSRPEGKAKLMSEVRTLTNKLPKGSSFRSLLNNDIYQKLTGRNKHQSNQQNLFVDFSTKMTLSVNLCLCLLYQPTLLAQDPINYIWQASGVSQIKISDKVMQRISESGGSLPSLPSWHHFGNSEFDNGLISINNQSSDKNGIGEFVHCVQSLLPHLPKDANATSHFILASLPSRLQQKISEHWKVFYASLMRDNIVDIEPLFQELLIQQLVSCLQTQKEQANSIFIQSEVNKRLTKLIAWQKTLNVLT